MCGRACLRSVFVQVDVFLSGDHRHVTPLHRCFLPGTFNTLKMGTEHLVNIESAEGYSQDLQSEHRGHHMYDTQ